MSEDRGERELDEKLTAAIDHWGPRFTANGVDASDFAEVASSIDSWSKWCQAWSAIGSRHEQLGHDAIAEERWRSAGEHFAQGATAFHFAKFLFVQYPEEARVAHEHAVRCLTKALPMLDPPGTRHLVPFEGSHLFGVLRVPVGRPSPVVVLIPGLDSTKEEFRLVERSFLERGLATFALDGPGQGEAEYEFPIRPDWDAPIAAVIEYLRGCHGIIGDQIGLWGVSLGGYYSARAAAGNRDVAACVALAGPYNFGDAWDAVPNLTREAFIVRSHSESEEDAREKAALLNLTGHAGAIRCPLLVVFGKRDRLFSWAGAARLAEEAGGPSTLLLLEEGNHGCANAVYRHRPATADWMAAQLRER